MNFYILLLILSVSIMSTCADRTISAKYEWLRVIKKKAEEAKEKSDPNDPQTRTNRHAYPPIYKYKGNQGKNAEEATTTTTTTKSPLDLIREEEEKERDRNPKGVLNLENDIKAFRKELKEVEEKYMKIKCTNNDHCPNGTCCMIDISDGYCQKPPHKLNKECSEFCPCGGENMECKITDNGRNKYRKQCLAKDVPESVNLRLIEILKKAKEAHLEADTRRVPRDSGGSPILAS